MRGALGHPAPAATGTEAAPLAREGHQAIDAARRTLKPREPGGEPAAPEKVLKLLLDKPRQPFSVAQTRGLHAEGLEMILDNLIDHTPSGIPRFAARGGPAHEGP